MWIFPWIKLSWYSCSMWDKLGWLNWLWHFLCEGLSSFNQKDFIAHIHGLAVYVKEGLLFAQDLSQENSTDSFLCFWLALLHSLSHFFFLYWSPSLSSWTVFCSVSSDIDYILLINPSAYVFVFVDVNVHHKDWLTYSGGTDTPGVFYYNFYYDLTQMVNFPTRIPGSDSHSPALLDLFLLTQVFLLKWVSLRWEILIM